MLIVAPAIQGVVYQATAGLCPDCGEQLHVVYETREGHNTEAVGYCHGCGYTESQIWKMNW